MTQYCSSVGSALLLKLTGNQYNNLISSCDIPKKTTELCICCRFAQEIHTHTYLSRSNSLLLLINQSLHHYIPAEVQIRSVFSSLSSCLERNLSNPPDTSIAPSTRILCMSSFDKLPPSFST